MDKEEFKLLITVVTDLITELKIAEKKTTAIEEESFDRMLNLLNDIKAGRAAAGAYRCPASDCYWSSPVAHELWQHLQHAHNFSNEEWGCPFCNTDVAGPASMVEHYLLHHVSLAGLDSRNG